MTRRRWILAVAGGVAVLLAVLAAAAGWWYHDRTAVKEVRGSSTVEFVPTEKPQAAQRPQSLVDEVPWPTFGYDNQRTHLSPFSHRPPYRQIWLLRARWLVEFPPVVGYGNVYVSQLRGVLYAVDAKTGAKRWTRRSSFCSAASPALARGLVIAAYIPPPCSHGPRGKPGQVVALRASDGKLRWASPIASESSPLVVGGLVIVGSWDHRVYALGLGTGKVVWSTLLDGEIESSAAYAAGTVYVGDNSGTVTALDLRSGRIRWKARSFSRFPYGHEYFYATPTVAYGRVFASNTDGTVYAFGSSTGHLLWASHVGTYVYTAPAVWNRSVYVGTYDGKFVALDAATGQQRWSREMPAAVHGAPTVMGGLVYLSTCSYCGQKGARYAKKGPAATFALNAVSGKTVWSFADGTYSPIVADRDRVYLTGKARVYALVERGSR